ncbi:MAG TPA: PA2779 family protein [Thermodesulfobacteriota bacterium]|nr:PA2779 family protein [Thermodesulfobacteriota bacterium]
MSFYRYKIYKVSIIIIILTSFTPVSLISRSAECAIAGSQMISPGGKTSVREINEEKIRRTLENKIVVEKLRSYGLSKEEVMAKMERMSDEQIHQLAALSDKIPAGGNGAIIAVVAILVVFVIIIVVLILLKKI